MTPLQGSLLIALIFMAVALVVAIVRGVFTHDDPDLDDLFPVEQDKQDAGDELWHDDDDDDLDDSDDAHSRVNIAGRLREIAASLGLLDAGPCPGRYGSRLVAEASALEVVAILHGYISEQDTNAIFGAVPMPNPEFVTALGVLADRIEHGAPVSETDVRDALAAEGAGG